MPNVHVSCQQAQKTRKAWEVWKNFVNFLMKHFVRHSQLGRTKHQFYFSLTVCCIINRSCRFLRNLFVQLCSGPKWRFSHFCKGSISDSSGMAVQMCIPKPETGLMQSFGVTQHF